jgi:hypothetical protein
VNTMSIDCFAHLLLHNHSLRPLGLQEWVLSTLSLSVCVNI